jgi:hypothetical protein
VEKKRANVRVAMALRTAPYLYGSDEEKADYQRQDGRHQAPTAINALGLLAEERFE